MTVADRIKIRREELNMTQEQLASKLGLKGKSSVCKMETSGDSISTKNITKYAKALNTTPAHLMGWDDIEETEKLIDAFSNKYDADKQLVKAFHAADDLTQQMVLRLLGLEKDTDSNLSKEA